MRLRHPLPGRVDAVDYLANAVRSGRFDRSAVVGVSGFRNAETIAIGSHRITDAAAVSGCGDVDSCTNFGTNY
jgi:hypothetical protein